jgi:NADH-quinone oxidoreductase subunit L
VPAAANVSTLLKVATALVPVLPFAGFLVTLLFGKSLLRRRADVVSLAAVTLSWVFSMYLFVHVFAHRHEALDWNAFSWITSGSFHVTWGFHVDSLTAIMLLVVGTIGMLVHYYSIGYMRGDEGYYRFFAYLNLFMFAMYILVLANNYLLMFLAWEGVGLCSYLLISFWFTRKAPSQAGKKAFLVNRIGDFGFMLGMLLMFLTFGSLQFTSVFGKAGSAGSAALLGICLLLFTGAVGKSAQFPLHVWLPDAMEGPTPVSALIHAATMVNAGVYMVARSYPLFIHSHAAMLVVMGIGAFTAIYAAGIALTQNDIKKVIAYSTVSQLGYMFMALGAGAWAAGIFHLFTHGFFKGLLFLGAGSVIHAMSGEQDMRKMGGLRKLLPVTYWTMIVGALANAGIFPLAGFFSKDEILGSAFRSGYWFIWIVGIITAFLTAFYMFRLIFMTFHNQSRAEAAVQGHIHESPSVMSVPLVLLAVPAALAGVVAGWPPDGGWIHKFLEPVFFDARQEAFRWIGVDGGLLLLSLVVALAGIGTAYVFYIRRRELPVRLGERLPWAYQASVNKFYMDEFYEKAAVRPTIDGAGWLWTFFDVKVVDGAVNGVAWLWARLARVLRPLQTGRAQDYAFGILIGVLVLVVAFRIF